MLLAIPWSSFSAGDERRSESRRKVPLIFQRRLRYTTKPCSTPQEDPRLLVHEVQTQSTKLKGAVVSEDSKPMARQANIGCSVFEVSCGMTDKQTYQLSSLVMSSHSSRPSSCLVTASRVLPVPAVAWPPISFQFPPESGLRLHEQTASVESEEVSGAVV